MKEEKSFYWILIYHVSEWKGLLGVNPNGFRVIMNDLNRFASSRSTELSHAVKSDSSVTNAVEDVAGCSLGVVHGRSQHGRQVAHMRYVG